MVFRFVLIFSPSHPFVYHHAFFGGSLSLSLYIYIIYLYIKKGLPEKKERMKTQKKHVELSESKTCSGCGIPSNGRKQLHKRMAQMEPFFLRGVCGGGDFGGGGGGIYIT